MRLLSMHVIVVVAALVACDPEVVTEGAGGSGGDNDSGGSGGSVASGGKGGSGQSGGNGGAGGEGGSGQSGGNGGAGGTGPVSCAPGQMSGSSSSSGQSMCNWDWDGCSDGSDYGLSCSGTAANWTCDCEKDAVASGNFASTTICYSEEDEAIDEANGGCGFNLAK